MKFRQALLLSAGCSLLGISSLGVSPLVFAEVTVDEAVQLKTTLTPMGAEKAGNKAGTIPAWTGGYTTVADNYKSGTARPDPFASEKPQFSITAKNMEQYAPMLSEGVKATLKKYPDTYRLDVYPTHRTAAAPQWVYDNTFQNATRAKTKNGGVWIEGAYGGIPFPIPKSGYEAMWNHTLAWVGETTESNYTNIVGRPDGGRSIAAEGHNSIQYPYYDRNGSLETFKGVYRQFRVLLTNPPYKAGESYLFVDSVDRSRQAWQYLTGQRRVRKAPTLGYDTPNDISSGQEYYDEAYVFVGDLDRYEWKLIGKREMYIPYNNQRLYSKPLEEQMLAKHLNPDNVRWELHRVWEVEATVAPGKRHAMPKRRFYLDEDTWGAVLADGWDSHDSLYHTSVGLPLIVSEAPFVHPTAYWLTLNLLTGDWVTGAAPNYKAGSYMKVEDRLPATFFTPEALAGEGVR